MPALVSSGKYKMSTEKKIKKKKIKKSMVQKSTLLSSASIPLSLIDTDSFKRLIHRYVLLTLLTVYDSDNNTHLNCNYFSPVSSVRY